VRNETLTAALAGDADATAEVLGFAEDLIRGYADSEEEQQAGRVRLWAALPGYAGGSFEAFAREVLKRP